MLRLSSFIFCLIVAAFSAGSAPVLAADSAAANPASKAGATLLADSDAIVPGGTFMLGLKLKVRPLWHTYWINPGDSGDAPRIQCKGPKGLEFGAVQFPLPHRFEHKETVTFGYENEVLLLVAVKVAKDADLGTEATIDVDAEWMTCDAENCTDNSAKLALKLPVGRQTRRANAELFDVWLSRLPTGLDASPEAVVSQVVQAKGDDGSPLPALTVQWKTAPKKVEWFPASTRAVAIEEATVKHDGQRTQIAFKPRVYQADKAGDGRLMSVLVYTDEKGGRRGVTVPFQVAVKK